MGMNRKDLEFWTNCNGKGVVDNEFITYHPPIGLPVKMLRTQEQMIIKGHILILDSNVKCKKGKIFAINYLLKMLTDKCAGQDLENFGLLYGIFVFKIDNGDLVASSDENFSHVGASVRIFRHQEMHYYYGWVLTELDGIFIKNKAVFNAYTWGYAISNPKIGFDIGTYAKLRGLFPLYKKHSRERYLKHLSFLPN